jgi:hypothetical protein
MFPLTIAYNKARIELHAQAVRYNSATDEEKENLPVGKLIPQEEITEELWSLLNSLPIDPRDPIEPPPPTCLDMSKLCPSLSYVEPELGLEVTLENIDWFIQTYSQWYLRVGYWGHLLDCDGDRVQVGTLVEGQYLPYTVC